MAINISFNGSTIWKPGSYSRTTIDLGGSVPLGPAGLIAIIGEADAGQPGSAETNIADNRYSADQLVQARNKYRSGPIADALSLLFAPAADAAIPNGAQTVWIYKTNSSVQSSLSLATSYGTVKAEEYGIGGDRITITSLLIDETPATTIGTAFDETAVTATSIFKIKQNGDSAEQLVSVAGAYANNAAFVADVATWSVAGIAFTAGGVDGASTLTIAMDALATSHTLGFGRGFEIAEDTNTPLAEMNMSIQYHSSSSEDSVSMTIDNKRDQVQETDIVGGEIMLEVGSTSNSASLLIDGSNIVLSDNSGVVKTLVKSSYAVLSDVVAEINLIPAWSASVSDSAFNQLSPDVLDQANIAAQTYATGKPARIKRDAERVKNLLDQSAAVSLTQTAVKGLPDSLIETALSGGAKGSTSPADVIAALDKFTKFHVNSIVPLFSRDATDDIADGLTDSGSTYTILGIHQAVKTHISLMKTTKKRSERQGYLSLRDSFVNCKAQAGLLADGRLQLAIQDVRQVDAQGVSKWFQPYALSAILAGSRGGAPIGEPLTFKFANVSGIRHTVDPMSTPDADITIDFDPDLQTDEAIQAGLTFLEAPQTGGFRFVVDNTTYGRDDNWVFNRANVLHAADIVAFNFRNVMENRFVGKKNTVSVADVSGVAQSALSAFLAQGITVSTTDAPNGYKDLTVRLEGNTIYIEVTIKLVEGIDFVISDIFLQRATA